MSVWWLTANLMYFVNILQHLTNRNCFPKNNLIAWNFNFYKKAFQNIDHVVCIEFWYWIMPIWIWKSYHTVAQNVPYIKHYWSKKSFHKFERKKCFFPEPSVQIPYWN
jgi:hypothetical protein